MDVASLLFLLLLVALGWFWLDSMRALEAARNAGRLACKNAGVQFLDDTVSSTGLALVRDTSGRRVLRRTYRFEFSETGNSRLEGRLVVLGNIIESITLEPYQILPQASNSGELLHFPNSHYDKTDSGGVYRGCCGGGGCGGRGGAAREPASDIHSEEEKS
jgi:hypothetical protein